MSKEISNNSFWVLEHENVPLYFGEKCNKGNYLVGIDEAVHFATKEDAEKMKRILENDFGLNFKHEPVEHSYFSVEHSYFSVEKA